MRPVLAGVIGFVGAESIVRADWVGLAVAVLAAVVSWLQTRRK